MYPASSYSGSVDKGRAILGVDPPLSALSPRKVGKEAAENLIESGAARLLGERVRAHPRSWLAGISTPEKNSKRVPPPLPSTPPPHSALAVSQPKSRLLDNTQEHALSSVYYEEGDVYQMRGHAEDAPERPLRAEVKMRGRDAEQAGLMNDDFSFLEALSSYGASGGSAVQAVVDDQGMGQIVDGRLEEPEGGAEEEEESVFSANNGEQQQMEHILQKMQKVKQDRGSLAFALVLDACYCFIRSRFHNPKKVVCYLSLIFVVVVYPLKANAPNAGPKTQDWSIARFVVPSFLAACNSPSV